MRHSNRRSIFYDLYMDKLGTYRLSILGTGKNRRERFQALYAKRGKFQRTRAKRMLAAYYGLITHIDNQLSRFLTAVEEFDLLENTIFWFVSDHGINSGNIIYSGKGYPYQGSIKIPSVYLRPRQLNCGYEEERHTTREDSRRFPLTCRTCDR